MRGRNFNYYLIDGTSTGRIKCTAPNWTGTSYTILRVDLEKFKDRDDLKQSGIYFLFGIDEDTGKDIVYVGQAQLEEGIYKNLRTH